MTRDIVLALLGQLNTVSRYRELADRGAPFGPDILDSRGGFKKSDIESLFPDFLLTRYYYVIFRNQIEDRDHVHEIWESLQDGPFIVGHSTRFMRVWIDDTHLSTLQNELRNNRPALRGTGQVSL